MLRALCTTFAVLAIVVAAVADEDVDYPRTPVLSYEPFYDDFSNGLDEYHNWRVAFKQWGGEDVNGGVIPENVEVSPSAELNKNTLKLWALGDQYDGELRGINKNMSARADGKRVGAAIATKKYYGSGSYEIRMKVAPMGACSAFWTFHYNEYYPGDMEYDSHCKDTGIDCPEDYWASNHEIDIELPTALKGGDDISFNHARFNSWVGENEGEYEDNFMDLGTPMDGAFHTYRFDWHTGDEDTGETKRVDFYVDDKKVKTITDFVPDIGGRVWIGAWFPKGWAGEPNFNKEALEVDYVKITPFKERGDRWIGERYKETGWSDADARPQQEEFYDDFSADCLDPTKWKVVQKNWGGQLGKLASWNGGVLPENLKLRDNQLVIEVHGNDYSGQMVGMQKDETVRKDGRRVGGVIASTKYFGSGRYEARMKIVPQLGVATAMWTFNYQEFYAPDPAYYEYCPDEPETCFVNHEVDFETPTSLNHTHPNTGISYSHGRTNVWKGLNEDEYQDDFITLPFQQNDGQFHTYRFDWHTGDEEKGIEPHVDWFIDDVPINTITGDLVPDHAGRFWLGAWFPRNWAGRSHFDVEEMVVDWVKITPFKESGDKTMIETYPVDGFGEDGQYPCQTRHEGPCIYRKGFHVGTAPGKMDIVKDGRPTPLWNPIRHSAVVKNEVNVSDFWMHMGDGSTQMIYRVNIENDAPVEEVWPICDPELTGLMTGLVEPMPNAHSLNVTYHCFNKGLAELTITIPIPDCKYPVTWAWHKECMGACDPDDPDCQPVDEGPIQLRATVTPFRATSTP